MASLLDFCPLFCHWAGLPPKRAVHETSLTIFLQKTTSAVFVQDFSKDRFFETFSPLSFSPLHSPLSEICPFSLRIFISIPSSEEFTKSLPVHFPFLKHSRRHCGNAGANLSACLQRLHHQVFSLHSLSLSDTVFRKKTAYVSKKIAWSLFPLSVSFCIQAVRFTSDRS